MSTLMQRFKIAVAKVYRPMLHFVARAAFQQMKMRQAADFVGSINLIGSLDYPQRELKMAVRSPAQVRRLHACRKEPETIEWLQTTIKPGDTVYDIGANVGAYTLIAASIGGAETTVYAFEPSASTFDGLCQNVRLNNLSQQVIPFQVALSDRTGVLQFEYSSTEPGAALHKLHYETDGANPHLDHIIGYRLDDFIDQMGLKLPTLIKMDVDGGELHILRGGARTIHQAQLRSVLVEVERDTASSVIAVMTDAGFTLQSTHKRGTEGIFSNLIFTRP